MPETMIDPKVAEAVRFAAEARKREIKPRQSFPQGKKALARQRRNSHARQGKRAARETRLLKTCLGRVMRDIARKAPEGDAGLARLLAERIYTQQRHDKEKVYSVHAPEVKCIAKGKVHKK